MFSHQPKLPLPPALSIQEISDLFKENKLSPVSLTKSCFDTIQHYDSLYNAFCYVDMDSALEQAEQAEKRWKTGTQHSPIDGIPTTIKDLFAVKGWPMRQGSHLMPDTPSSSDSPAVAHLRRAGAVFLGKTNTPEFGHKGVTDSPLTGITRNPHNPDKTPGGSSGGAAVAAALRMGYIHLGSDGGGSCRIPASFTGVFGFKPTQNTIPIAPKSFFYDFATPGLLAGFAEDFLSVLPILQAPHSEDHEHHPVNSEATPLLKKHRLGYLKTMRDTPVAPIISTVIENALKETGPTITVQNEHTSCLDESVNIFAAHWAFGAQSMLADFPASDKSAYLDPNLATFEKHGQHLSSQELTAAKKARKNIKTACNSLFKKYDFLILPTTPMTSFDAGCALPPHPETGEDWLYWSPFTYFANMAGLPAVSLPIGYDTEGLPIGLQVIAPAFHDANLLELSKILQTIWKIKPRF